MTRSEFLAIRSEIAMWGLFVLANTAEGWWRPVFAALGIVMLWALWRLDRAIDGGMYDPPRPGFWARVWGR